MAIQINPPRPQYWRPAKNSVMEKRFSTFFSKLEIAIGCQITDEDVPVANSAYRRVLVLEAAKHFGYRITNTNPEGILHRKVLENINEKEAI
jgi:hypothetical protein